MAELEKKFFGRLKGKLGDVVFRSRNEKNYIAHKPKSYNIPDNPAFKNRTGRFRTSVKIASAIYSSVPLKNIWKKITPAGKIAFSNLVQVNYPFVQNGDITNMVMLVPRSAFGVNLQTLTLDADTLNIELGVLSEISNIDSSVEKKIQLYAIVFMNNPVNSALPVSDILKMSSAKQLINFNDPLTFNIAIGTADKAVAENYSNKKVLFTALTFDENDNVVQYSSTIYHAV